jgi:hypothetical protein
MLSAEKYYGEYVPLRRALKSFGLDQGQPSNRTNPDTPKPQAPAFEINLAGFFQALFGSNPE